MQAFGGMGAGSILRDWEAWEFEEIEVHPGSGREKPGLEDGGPLIAMFGLF